MRPRTLDELVGHEHIVGPDTILRPGMGYAQGYRYGHGFKKHQVEQRHLPDELGARKYYSPGNQGLQANAAKRLEHWDKTPPAVSR